MSSHRRPDACRRAEPCVRRKWVRPPPGLRYLHGQHARWGSEYAVLRARIDRAVRATDGLLLTSGGFGTMGFGYGAAYGAKLANPKETVIHCTGDGCFRMNCHELATVEHYHLPIITVIFNNGCLGMVRQLQDLFYGGRLNAVDIPDQPDFVKLAEAYGAEGYRVAKLEDLESTLRTAFASPNTAIIDVIVERDENVYPTVPSGASLDEMLLL